MKRFELDHDYGMCGMAESADGEWIRYEDHCDAMKRIAGDGRTDAELTEAAKESINVAIELMVVHYGKGWSTHVNVLRNLLDGPSFAHAAPATSASPDEARFRWLTDDLAGDEREARNRLLERMAVMSYSASCDAIDEAMRVEEESK